MSKFKIGDVWYDAATGKPVQEKKSEQGKKPEQEKKPAQGKKPEQGIGDATAEQNLTTQKG